MATQRRMRFVHGVTAWLCGTVLVLAALDAFAYELFFVLALIGVLIVTELTAPVAVAPRWRRRLRWVLAAGLAVFGYIVVRRVLEILPPEVWEAVGWT